MMRVLIVFVAAAALMAGGLSAQEADMPAFSWLKKPGADVAKLEARIAELESDKAALIKVIKEYDAEVKQLQAERPPVVAKVVMECLEDCDGCDHWWTGPDPEVLLDKHWQIGKKTIKNPPPGVFYPRWRVCIGDDCGYIEYTPNFFQALGNYVQQRELRRRLQSGRPTKSAR
jgi:hypothetical protein